MGSGQLRIHLHTFTLTKFVMVVEIKAAGELKVIDSPGVVRFCCLVVIA